MAIISRFCVLAFCVFAFASAESEKGAKDALEKALNSIESRITSTAAADEALQTEVQNNCTRDLMELDRRIAHKSIDILAKEKQINDTLARIDVLESQIDGLEAELTTARDDKTKKQESIKAGDTQRAAEAAIYKQYDSDTKVAIDAVQEVQGIVASSKLGAGADDSADDFKNKTLRATNEDDYSNAGLSFLSIKTSTLLKKLSGRVVDPNVKSFIQMAALSASAMQEGGDVSQLNELLAQLVVELTQYRVDLKKAEETAIQDWTDERAALVAAIDLLVIEINRLVADIQDKQRQLAIQQGFLATFQNDLAILEKEKRDYEAQREALDTMCKDEQAQFLERKERRDEEQKTLDAIRKVIEEKLNVMTSHSDAGIGYSAETGYRWVVGTYDGVACIDRIQTKPSWCIQSETQAKELNTVLCGPSPKNIRRSCRNEKPKDNY